MSPRTAGTIALAGVLGWLGLIWLGLQLYSTDPPTAAFDLELLLKAGRDVAAGRSPYDPAMLAGAAPVAERLFYSYPPVVAQAMSLFAAVPSPLMFVAWTAGAVAGLGAVGRQLGRCFAPDVPSRVIVFSLIALTPLMFPFAIGLLFGNLDVFFPLLYGLLLAGVGWTPTSPSTAPPGRAAVAAGVAAAVAAGTKLHPASLALWLAARAMSDGAARRALAAAIGTGIGLIVVSLLVGGLQPWLDYAQVIRAGSGADLVDPRNAGPAAQIALVLGGLDAEGLARTLQIPVTVIALALTVAAGWRLRDPVESLAWAAAASLVILPVTWYHYPSALIPFALVAVLRARGSPSVRPVAVVVGLAMVMAAAALSWLLLLYVSIGLVLVAVRMSRGPALP